MCDRDAELAVRLEAAAKAAIAKVLANRPLPTEATLADIEQSALTAGQEIRQAIAAELARESAAELPAWPHSPECGQKMKPKGKRHRRIVTEAVEIEVERLYYDSAPGKRRAARYLRASPTEGVIAYLPKERLFPPGH